MRRHPFEKLLRRTLAFSTANSFGFPSPGRVWFEFQRMRLIFVLILLFSLPVLVVAHRQFYSTTLQAQLLGRLAKALDTPEFEQVEPSLDYMDVTLKGRVADLASREKARQLADALPGPALPPVRQSPPDHGAAPGRTQRPHPGHLRLAA
jgi:hypothetical protein